MPMANRSKYMVLYTASYTEPTFSSKRQMSPHHPPKLGMAKKCLRQPRTARNTGPSLPLHWDYDIPLLCAIMATRARLPDLNMTSDILTSNHCLSDRFDHMRSDGIRFITKHTITTYIMIQHMSHNTITQKQKNTTEILRY